MKNFCQDLIDAKFIVKNSAACWFTDFDAYIIKQGLTIPLEEKEFNEILLTWVS